MVELRRLSGIKVKKPEGIYLKKAMNVLWGRLEKENMASACYIEKAYKGNAFVVLFPEGRTTTVKNILHTLGYKYRMGKVKFVASY